jgi:hypothetical protein
MNKSLRTALLCFAVFASALMIIALVITASVRGAMADKTPSATLTGTQSSGYWLRAYDGHIAVYDNQSSDKPIIETTIDVDSLRTVDKAMLSNGIEAESYEDVLKLLEDFGS